VPRRISDRLAVPTAVRFTMAGLADLVPLGRLYLMLGLLTDVK
jgi:hypothetical protein